MADAALIRDPRPHRKHGAPVTPLRLAAYAAAALALAPIAAVIWLAATGARASTIPLDQVGRYALTSAALGVLVAIGVTVLGSIAAWLVVMYRFPARRLFAWALVLPLAAPAFAIAYGYADLLDVAGPVRTAIRAVTGRDLIPFEIRSLPGAAMVLTLA